MGLGARRPARLAGDQRLDTAVFQRRTQEPRLRGFPGALPAFEGDEPCAVQLVSSPHALLGRG